MRGRLVVVGALFLLFCALVTRFFPGRTQASAALTRIAAAEPPAGDPAWLASPAAISAMRTQTGFADAREHGWEILDALVPDSATATNDAAWEGWETKCTLGLGGTNPKCVAATGRPQPCPAPVPAAVPAGAVALETPVQQKRAASTGASRRHPPPAAPGGFAFLSSVRYDLDAARFIRQERLCGAAGVMEMEQHGRQFPRSSRIVKLIWAVAADNGEIHVWDPDFAHLDTYPTGPQPYGDWPKVTVNLQDASPCPVDAHPAYSSYPAVGTAGPASTVPVNCFYHRTTPCSALVSPSASMVGVAYTCNNSRPNATFELLLMGAHVITAEQSDWVWATYWWTPDPGRETAAHGDQPMALKHRGPWWFYAMNITLDQAKPLAADHLPHIVFNPYLEGVRPYGTSANCMYCHGLAVMRPGSAPHAASEFSKGMPPRCVFAANPCAPGRADDAAYYAGATRTHMLWSVADNLDSDASRNLTMYQQLHRPVRIPR